MPADSDLTLPHTWRPMGVRMAGIVGCAFLFVVCAAAWIAFPPHIRDLFTLYERATMIFLGLLVLACFHALVRCRATATEQKLVVVNGYKKREFAWAEVVAVTMPRGAPWAVIDLSDGEICKVMAIQGSDGTRARKAITELRTLIP
ncbi:MAG: PH domain-containing protein [Nocardioides sp.]|nr:PH domain-containing protein [Nocardioides sp.]